MAKKNITPNYDYLRYSHIQVMKKAYENYKKELKKGIDMTSINDNGEFYIYGDANKERIEEAKESYISAHTQYKKFMEDKSYEL